FWRELPIARTLTATDGTFTVRGVEPGANLLLVRKRGLDTGSRPRVLVQAAADKNVGDVKLGCGEVVHGIVRGTDGKPVAGAEVRIGVIGALGYRGIAFAQQPVTSGPDGFFTFSGMGRGRAFVAARAAERDPFCVVGPVEIGEDVTVQLPARSELR